jgi:hypothetical protein
MPKIEFYSSNFPTWSIPNGWQTCNCTWAELVWAALTVGKAELNHVLRFGNFSLCELAYRAFIIFANLQQGRSSDEYLYASDAYNALDPSEKRFISYFLGMTSAKLLAGRYLNAPWLMHLDVYADKLNPQTVKGRSKPDLVGFNQRSQWIVIEAKGRSNKRDDKAIIKAKTQAVNLRTIAGQPPVLRIALQSYFRESQIEIYWSDPEPNEDEKFDLEIELEDFYKSYYSRFLEIFRENDAVETENIDENPFHILNFEEIDLKLGLHASLLNQGTGSITDAVRQMGSIHTATDDPNKKIGGDGIYIGLGDRWGQENMVQQEIE